MSTNDFMSFMPDDILIPDLKNIVFEYANSYEIELQQIQQLEEKQHELKKILSTKLQKLPSIDSMDVLQLIIADDEENSWMWFQYEDHYAIHVPHAYKRTIKSYILQMLLHATCITNICFASPNFTIPEDTPGFSLLTIFTVPNNTTLPKNRNSFRWLPLTDAIWINFAQI